MSELEFHSPSHALKYWLEKRGVTAYQLAKDTLLTPSRISEILSNKRRITTEAATILGVYFGNGADYWAAIQTKSDLLEAQATSDDWLTFESRGDLPVGGYALRCYVLPDERRVVSAAHFFLLFGINSMRVGPKRLADLIDNPLLQSQKMDTVRKHLVNPIKVADERGSFVLCYEGELVVDFCRALLDVRRIKDALPKYAYPYAEKAELILVSIAKVGIIALIDEATGYQAKRHRHALQQLLDAYFQKEKYAAWTKVFPDWYYEEIFRLRHWDWTSLNSKNKRPPVVGKITKDIVYSRLESGVIEELERRNPVLPSGGRKVKHHQWLSDELGHPALDRHFYALRGLFRSHRAWPAFYHALQMAHPRKNELVQLEFDDYKDDE